jgi:outer membrane receptor for ferric coprogen and ferric-rhodotorulic acid
MSSEQVFQPRKTRVCRAVQGALVSLALAMGAGAIGGISGINMAQAAEPASIVQPATFNVPAGPLAPALVSFAGDAGISVSAAPELVQHIHTKGVSGTLSLDEAFSRLLAGTGLQAIATGSGGRSYSLRPVATSGAAGNTALPVVAVTADRDSEASYTAPAQASAATPLGLTIRETPQAVSLITKQRMEDQGLTSLRQTLEQAPGLTLTSMGTERYYPVSRGYTVNNFQIDGLSTYAEYYGLGEVSPQGMADMAVYDSVEILRGASGLVTGAGNPSGAINLVRKKPTAQFQGSAELGAGSWNNKRGMIDLSGPLNEARTSRGRLVTTWENGDSFIDNYSKDKKLFYGIVEADLSSSTKLTLGFEHQENRYKGQFSYVGFPLFYSNGNQTDLPRSFSSASRDNRLGINSNTFFATLDQELGGGWKFKASANTVQSSQTDKVAYLAEASGVPDQATGNGLTLFAEQYLHDTRTDAVDVNVRGPVNLFGREHELVFGADFNNFVSNTDRARDTSGLQGSAVNIYTWDRTGVVVPGASYMKYDSTRRQLGLYGAGRFSLSDQLKLIVGAREFKYSANYVTRSSTLYSPSPQSGSNVFTPYGGLVYDINNAHSVYGSYTVIYKPQTSQDTTGAFLAPVEGAY